MRGQTRSRSVRISVEKCQLGILPGHLTFHRLILMNRRMLFKLGVSVVVAVAVVLFYLVNVQEDRLHERDNERSYRNLMVGGGSDDYISSQMTHKLRNKMDQEVLDKHHEAFRIHKKVTNSKDDSLKEDEHSKQSKNNSRPKSSPKHKRKHNEDADVEERHKKSPVVKSNSGESMHKDKMSTKKSQKVNTEKLHLLDEKMEQDGKEAAEINDDSVGLEHEEMRKESLINKTAMIDLTKSEWKHDFVFESEALSPNIKRVHSETEDSSLIHLCVVVCGSRGSETLTMLKSAAMVTPVTQSLVFHIFAEPENQQFFQNELDIWPLAHKQRLSYHIYNVTFPDSQTTNLWKKLFKPCASQRLFLPDLLQTVERLIYVDTDTIFLESLSHLWSYFDDFNTTQLAGLVGEAEVGFAAWYNRFANHPYYGKYGLNSGVMLMDLSRLRHTTWLSDMQQLFHQYRLALPWGDQDLINIYFAHHPDQMYLLPCKWNYRNDHCRYTSNCMSAEREGVSVLHGSRRTFESGKEPLLKVFHKAFSKYELGDDMEYHFLEGLQREINEMKPKSSNCWKVSDIFLRQVNYLKDRNKEFMRASRKAHEQLSAARKQARAKDPQPVVRQVVDPGESAPSINKQNVQQSGESAPSVNKQDVVKDEEKNPHEAGMKQSSASLNHVEGNEAIEAKEEESKNDKVKVKNKKKNIKNS